MPRLYTPQPMLTHYLKILLRRRPLFTALNLSGLAIGMVACLLIFKYVRYEWQYDQQSPHANHIWRVFNQTLNGATVLTEDANSHSAVGPTLRAEVPGVVDFARLYCGGGSGEITALVNGQAFEVPHFFCTDPGFLRMFPQQVLLGNGATSLDAPYSTVLTASTAQRFFGRTDVLGAHFTIPSGTCAGDYTVTAVVTDPPPNTHLKFDLLTSYASRYAQGHEDNFNEYWDYTYLQLAPGTDPAAVRQRLASINEQHLQKEGIRLDIQRFSDIHLHSNLTYELEPNGRARTVHFLGLVALFILGIAFINYVNLATALARERAREVGIRKAIGASRSALARQFLLESLLLSGLAFAVAAGLLDLSLPAFSRLIGQPLDAVGTVDWTFWGTAVGGFAATALLAGIYPALVLSGFRPIEVLRGRFESGSAGLGLRRSLVVLQFVCCVGLVFGVVVVSRQVDFLKNHDLGVQLDQVVALHPRRAEGAQDTLASQRLARFKNACAQLSGFEGVAASGVAPGLGINSVSGSSRPLRWVKNPAFVRTTTYFVETDAEFFDLYGAPVLAGQIQLFPDRARRFSHVAINRTLLNLLGFPNPESAIGEQLAFENAEGDARTTITAVVEDFHLESLKTPTKPTLYYCLPPEQLSYISVKIRSDNAAATLGGLQEIWQKIYPEQPFRYWFLDEHFAAQYHSETRFGQVFSLFAGLAVLIACLGLFGLVAHSAERRRREIGIRKVLGASVVGVAALLARDYLRLVLLATAIALPVAWWLLRQWLGNFAYRIQLEWWMFALTGLLAVAVALLTVGFQSVRAALANPAQSLRSE